MISPMLFRDEITIETPEIEASPYGGTRPAFPGATATYRAYVADPSTGEVTGSRTEDGSVWVAIIRGDIDASVGCRVTYNGLHLRVAERPRRPGPPGRVAYTELRLRPWQE